MSTAIGVHLLPSTGEFTYDTLPYNGARVAGANGPINAYYAPGGNRTDYSYAIDQLQAAHPECTTVSIVCAWFGNSLNAASCQIYPSTTFAGGSFQQASGGGFTADSWRVSGLTQASLGLIALPTVGGAYVYGGTPSDQSIVRCIQDLKTRGLKVIFYPFILMTAPGFPWRGRISFAPDISSAATSAVSAFLGAATRTQFTPDPVNLTVAYSGAPTDYTYRRMVLHYAWLCTVAGGVNEFLLGSELRGLETIRGPGWTPAGTLDGSGYAIWDYPFVAGLQALADDVRAIFDSQGLTKNIATLSNLISYAADWSVWMGYQHPGANGQWPHLDSLWAKSSIDVVGIDNYMPLSDWTTGTGGLDVANWTAPAYAGAWPPPAGSLNGLGLSGSPSIYSKPYIKANIEGGEKFNWFYNDSNNLGRALDPNGSDQFISSPENDRLGQSRNPYYANQQLLGNKQMRWWWNNTHRAIYDTGSGWAPQGAPTQWQAQSKSLAFNEYGIPACDRGTNQPNVFYDPKSSESFTPFWSLWQEVSGSGYLPQRDDTLALLALQAIYEYWNTDGHNMTSMSGVPLIQFSLSCIWNWDARPFPVFPALSNVWGDAANWPYGQWLGGRGPALPPLAPSAAPGPASYATFPAIATLGASSSIKPRFSSQIIDHVSGRSTRRALYAAALYEIVLSFDFLRSDAVNLEMQGIAGFFTQMQGQASPFWLAPPGLTGVSGQVLGIGDGVTTNFPLVRTSGVYSEPVAGTSGVAAVYNNRIVAPRANWSVSGAWRPAIVFSTAPASGSIVTADFAQLWLCRFAQDIVDLEEFMAMLFTLKTVTLQTVRL